MRTIPVVNCLLRTAYAAKADDDLTPLRVQKLLYQVHGWYLAITGESILDEAFIAGRYGPELPSLRSALAAYSGMPVDEYIEELDWDLGKMGHFFVNAEKFPQFETVLKRVFDTHRHLTTTQLSSLAHAEGSAWTRTPQDGVIDNMRIREDFVRQARENETGSR